jgi:hypothetical protein
VNKQRQNTKSLRLRLTLSPDSSKVAIKSAEKKEQQERSAAAGGCSKTGHHLLAPSSSSPADRKFASKELKVKMNNLLQSEKSNIERMRKSRADVVTRHNVVSQSQTRRTVTVTKDAVQEAAKLTSADGCDRKNINCNAV